MHPDLMQELNTLHIQDLHRWVARHRFANPRTSIRRFRGRATRAATMQSKRAQECGTHA